MNVALRHIGFSRRARGFTLAEAAISTVIIAFVMVGALTSIQKTGLFRRITADQQVGFLMAQQLMVEIQCYPYADPTDPWSAIIGPEADEIAGGTRSKYDDIDDYNGWTEQPPKLPDGTAIANRTSWYRTVTVQFVKQDNLDVVVAADYGIKRITVEVGTVVAGGSVLTVGDRRPAATLVAIAGRGRM